MVASPPAEGQVVGALAALHSHVILTQVRVTSPRDVLGWITVILKRGLCRLLTPTVERQTLYEEGWDSYAESWERSVQQPGMQYVGDEWGSPALSEDIIDRYVKPYLHTDAIALEIGCGEGKYSEKLAPLGAGLICADVSGRMLERAKQRLQGCTNIEFAKLNGLDLNPFASESIDFVFSFDCFVHIEIEDVYCYLQEIKRVLKPGGGGLLHFANLNSDEGWHKFITEAPLNRGRQKHFDRFCFLTWEIVEKFFRSLELNMVTSQREPWRDILVVFHKGTH
jgi:SAM-dependent methyltransferase